MHGVWKRGTADRVLSPAQKQGECIADTTMRMPYVVFVVCCGKASLSLRLPRGVPLVQDLRGGVPVPLEGGNRPRPKENPVGRGIDQGGGEGDVVGPSPFP